MMVPLDRFRLVEGLGMARIPDEVLTRLKAEVSVQRLVEGCGVQLRVQGRDLVGRCPFHDDSTPSLVVTPGKNLWNCLGACRRGGGPIDWVMAAQGVSFRLAVELLQQESPSLSTLAQSSPSSQGPGLVSKSSTRKLPLLASPEVSDADLAAAVVDHYAATLAGSPEALGYVAKRGVDHPEVIGMFRLGYANRTLGYRLGHSQTKTGGTLRARLQSASPGTSISPAPWSCRSSPPAARSGRCTAVRSGMTCGRGRRPTCTCPARIGVCSTRLVSWRRGWMS
jgi:hypothetical protein